MTSYKETLQETKIGRDSISQGEYAIRMGHIICRTQCKMKMQNACLNQYCKMAASEHCPEHGPICM